MAHVTSPVERFWSKVDKTETCWLWTASTGNGGYAQFWTDGARQMAHRVAYEWLVGPIPQGLELDHLCRVRHCVNPDHLEPVTHAENIRRSDVGKRLAAKTHCPQGHAYAEHGVVLDYESGTRRRCQTCHRESQRRYVAKKRKTDGIVTRNDWEQRARAAEARIEAALALIGDDGYRCASQVMRAALGMTVSMVDQRTR